jgi:hypothetical protein
MKETREKKINNKIFKKQDIINIWNCFKLLKKESLNPEKSEINMQIRCYDSTRYESSEGEFLKEGDIFDIKKIESIDLEYRFWDENGFDKVVLDIKQGEYGYFNLLVSSSKKDWVVTVFDKFEEIIKSLSPQKDFLKKYSIPLNIVIIIIFEYMFIKLMIYFFPENMTRISFWEIIFNFTFGTFVLFLIMSYSIFDYLKKLWPVIEFDFGPEHLKIEKQKRNYLWLWFTVLILPLIISLII